MSRQTRRDRTIAVDPGYDRVGIAVFGGNMLIHSGCFTPKSKNFGLRLCEVYRHITTLIHTYRPAALALETLFFSKNQKTAIRVAEARGVIELAAVVADISIAEYSPQAVKIAVTGNGSASKDAVIRMVDRLLPLKTKKRLDDEYDAIALGIAHIHTQQL